MYVASGTEQWWFAVQVAVCGDEVILWNTKGDKITVRELRH